MANDKFISSETLFAWGSSFNTTKKIPVIAKRVWQTYEDMFNYVSDANDTCIAGIVLTVVNDEDVTKNGAYFVVSCPTLEEPTITPAVKKIGSDEGISEDINDIKTLLGDDSGGLVKDVADLRTTVDNLPESFVTNVKVGETSLVDGGVVDLSNFVQKEDSKGLSSNDFTDALKNKLATIADGAEVNYIKSVDEANLNVDESGKLTVSIPEVEVPFQSVATNDKVLTLDNDGVLSSTLSYVREVYNGKDCLVLKGKNEDVLGAIEVADFVADGMLESVTPKKDSPNIFVFTFNSAAGSKSFEVDFSKYVDTYNADGVTLELGENNTFKVKDDVFVKADSYLPYIPADQNKLATIAEGAQVNTIESITLNDVTLAVDGSKNINIDLSAYATIADTSANFVQKEDGKGLSTNDFTTELKTKLDGIKDGAEVNVVKEVDTTGVLGLDASGKLSADLSAYALSATVDGSLAKKVDAVENKSLVDDTLITKLGKMKEITSVEGDLSLTEDGVLTVDLSAYATIADTSANFVQKEDGKGLSTNDFTDALKSKLDNIEGGAQVNVVKEVDTTGVLGLDASGKLTVDLSDYALSATVDGSLANKLDATATVNGVSFDDGKATLDAGVIKASEAFGTLKEGETTRDRYTTNDSVQSILTSLDSRIDSINTIFDETFEGVIVSVQGSNAIGVTTGTSPEISLKVSDASGNVVSVESDGVYVPDMRSYWESI